MPKGNPADLPLPQDQNTETALRGVCTDFGFAWQWQVFLGDEVLYEGAALSEAAAWRAVESTIRVFGTVGNNAAAKRPVSAD